MTALEAPHVALTEIICSHFCPRCRSVADVRRGQHRNTDEGGRILDLHRLRHTFGTHLNKNDVAPPRAQTAMRHPWVHLSMRAFCAARAFASASRPDVRENEGGRRSTESRPIRLSPGARAGEHTGQEPICLDKPSGRR
jgi:hypothetical protein